MIKKHNFRTERTQDTNFTRTPMSTELPFSIDQVCPTIPNSSHGDSLAAGWMYRVARAHPTTNRTALRNIRNFTIRYCSENFQKLRNDEQIDFDEWLTNSNYTVARQEQLREARRRWRNGEMDQKKFYKVKGFTKEESYGVEHKHFRSINSRSDAFKAETGPMFKKIEEKVFCKKEFIKKIPNNERARYIMDNVYTVGGTYVCTDYTSYESSFTKEIMSNIEYVVYKYIAGDHPDWNKFDEYYQAILGQNKIQYRNFNAKIDATRMSGEMNTSLGNGITNLILFKWCCWLQNIKSRGVVEGDDGLFNVSKVPDFDPIRSLGFTIKPEVHKNIGDASFCGQVFSPESMQIVRDPLKAMIKMGWSTSQYKYSKLPILSSLMKARALSSLHENPGCPILNKWNLNILSRMKNVKIEPILERMHCNMYEREKLLKINEIYKTNPNSTFEHIYQEPTPHTRLLVERLYNITTDAQRLIEEKVESHIDGRFVIPLGDLWFSKANIMMFENYRSRYEPFFVKKMQINGIDAKCYTSLFSPIHTPYTHNHSQMQVG